VVIESFPIISGNQKLVVEDFQRFSQAFNDILLRKVPTAKYVRFVFNEEHLRTLLSKEDCIDDLVVLFRSVCEDVDRCGLCSSFIMIPFGLSEGVTVVALVSKPDPLFIKRVSDDWLIDVRNKAGREFLLLKQARMDDLTGLFNLSNLHLLLDSPSAAPSVQLILVEISAKYRSYQQGTNHLYSCVSNLKTFIPEGGVIHYLGNSLFAVVLEFQGDGDKSKLVTSLVAFLKREGFARVHVGTSHRNKTACQDEKIRSGYQLLDEAWTALRAAAKRGPFGFCDFALIAHPEKHKLIKPKTNLIRRLRRLWKNSDHFCLVYFRSDNRGGSVDERVWPFLDKGTAVLAENDLIVFLDQSEGHTALQWAEKIVRNWSDFDANRTVSAGVACFPYNDFKKSEIPYNCCKALAHAAFFGKAGVALFDAVSLNISGDIYYGDGDLLKAVKEYDRGLRCDKSNVNLHNSLGVTLTMMNKFSAAKSCFKDALKLDENSFMALYNIGLGELNSDRKKEAITYFKRALDCDFDEDIDGLMLKNDLKCQIGILASETADYQVALDYLLPWYETCQSVGEAGRAVYNIGKSLYGLGQSRKAMEWLQKALRNNEFDSRAMNLLGQVYYNEGEGEEVALSLCTKSVELDPGNLPHRLVLAKVQIQCGMFLGARENLKKCLKDQELRAESQLYLAQCYMGIGQHKRALNWFKKVGPPRKKQAILYNKIKQYFET